SNRGWAPGFSALYRLSRLSPAALATCIMPCALAACRSAPNSTLGSSSSAAALKYPAIISSLSRCSEMSNGSNSTAIAALLLQRLRHRLRRFDVPLLRSLVAAHKQEIDGEPAADEIDPVARPDVDPELGDAFTRPASRRRSSPAQCASGAPGPPASPAGR